ncbi:hypothetical protein ABK040_007465 [Willaertia magna]
MKECNLSERLRKTDTSFVNKIGEMITEELQLNQTLPFYNLSQGKVNYNPPKEALESFLAEINNVNHPFLHTYCEHDFGRRELRNKLKEKLFEINGLQNIDVVVTNGANQAFAALALALSDPGDSCIMFTPYFFNHLMALQMFSINSIEFKCFEEENYVPNIEKFKEFVDRKITIENCKIKMCVLNSPCNPTGAVIPKEQIDQIASVCEKYGIWLICDETYEYFVYDDIHYSPNGNNIIHLNSFSKAFGMAGWRVGYIAFPEDRQDLFNHLNKIMDTIPISCAVPSQQLALSVLRLEDFGRKWVKEKVKEYEANRKIIWDAISTICELKSMPRGAIYYWAKFPNFKNDATVEVLKELQVVEWILRKYRVAIFPGSSFGFPGCFRISYANVSQENCKQAMMSLVQALEELANGTADISSYVKTFIQ